METNWLGAGERERKVAGEGRVYVATARYKNKYGKMLTIAEWVKNTDLFFESFYGFCMFSKI